jgi:hypothetical protein
MPVVVTLPSLDTSVGKFTVHDAANESVAERR